MDGGDSAQGLAVTRSKQVEVTPPSFSDQHRTSARQQGDGEDDSPPHPPHQAGSSFWSLVEALPCHGCGHRETHEEGFVWVHCLRGPPIMAGKHGEVSGHLVSSREAAGGGC